MVVGGGRGGGGSGVGGDTRREPQHLLRPTRWCRTKGHAAFPLLASRWNPVVSNSTLTALRPLPTLSVFFCFLPCSFFPAVRPLSHPIPGDAHPAHKTRSAAEPLFLWLPKTRMTPPPPHASGHQHNGGRGKQPVTRASQSPLTPPQHHPPLPSPAPTSRIVIGLPMSACCHPPPPHGLLISPRSPLRPAPPPTSRTPAPAAGTRSG